MYVVMNPSNICKKEERSPWSIRASRYQRPKSCSGYTWRHQYFHNVTRATRYEAMYRSDEEYKEYFKFYHISYNILDYKDLPESWWDEKARRTEGCWKSQYKVNRQYNIHSSVKDSMSIRSYEFEEPYTAEEVDRMLEEEYNGIEEDWKGRTL